MRLTITNTGQITDQPATPRVVRRRRASYPDRITRVRRTGDVIELGLRQSNLRSVDADRLRSELVSFHRPGDPPHIVLSLRGLEVLSGCCVGTLAEVADSLSRLGGTLILSDVPTPTSRMLKRSGLSKTLRLARSGAHARRLALTTKKRVRAA